ncbi:hypothetical protein DJ568_13690 [Mucilaginibacter hurinus]|uniref:Outer membrane protein beta-barrel domain-containing protein n=1 Tax=Mucilaginibacter hurinus TaxID=2201324 RepID=A0A367GLJ0_9SPHI|nr:hypothetical protein [Mucilaginibacter hurinus]RCH54337.1 hypothetical protein DJ568_13690 [Mucilaginibacter hurinus]
MYKVIITFMLLLYVHAANAQTEKGKQNIGLGLRYSHSKNTTEFNNYSSNQNSASLQYSYFIADKVDLGAEVAYYYIKSGNNSSSQRFSSTANGFGSRIQLRKYFLFENKIGVRTGPYLDYLSLNNDDNDVVSLSSRKSARYSTGISADLVYYPTEKIGIAAGIGALQYSYAKTTGDYPSSGNSLSLALTNGINLYFYYVF